MNDAPRKSYLPFLMVQFVLFLAMLLFVVFLLPGAWNARRFLGLAMMIIGAILLFTARFQLGNSFAVTPQARELVTHGLYSKIRNPIYVFSSLLVLGLFIVIGRPYLFALLALLVAMQTFRAHKESRVLEAKFGEQYREYHRHTWF